VKVAVGLVPPRGRTALRSIDLDVLSAESLPDNPFFAPNKKRGHKAALLLSLSISIISCFEGVTGHFERNYISPCFMHLRQFGGLLPLDKISASS
jgi:hypothetical protein